jgi:two-component system sensor histidine kinase/response regulator
MAQPCLLIVEDNTAIREQMVTILEMNGYTVLATANGNEGMRVACHHQPALIISDVMMPECNGLDMLREIRRTPELARTPVVLLSALIANDDIRKGLELGANAYLIKPFRIDELLRVVAKHLPASPRMLPESA